MERKSLAGEQKLSPFSLMFQDEPLELKFRQSQKSTDLFFVRYLALVIFVIELLYSVKDINWSPHLPQIIVYFRAFYLTPLMLVIALLSFHPPFKRSPFSISFVSLAMIVSLIFGQYFMTALNPDVESSFAKTLPLLLFSTFLFTGAKFKHIAILTPLILISFIVTMVYFREADNSTRINDSLLVVMNIALAVFFKYMQELSQRKIFLRSIALEQNENELTKNLMTERKLSALRKNLIGILAHDIRSPLSNVRSILRLSDEKTISDDERSALFNNLDKRIATIDEGVNDLLIWVKSQEEGLKIEAKDVNVRSTTRDAIALFQEEEEKKTISTTVDISRRLVLRTDPGIFKTIIRNLYGNAIKFSYDNGRIVLKAFPENDGVTFAIEDQGIGMSSEVIEKVTHQLYSTPGTNNEKGTGLGLNICFTLLEKLNSELQFISKEGEGTTATFHLKNNPNN